MKFALSIFGIILLNILSLEAHTLRSLVPQILKKVGVSLATSISIISYAGNMPSKAEETPVITLKMLQDQQVATQKLLKEVK